MPFFGIFQLLHLITRKRKRISKFREILSPSARQDLSAVWFSWRSVRHCRSYCPFNAVFSNFFTLTFDISESIIVREVIQIGICCFWCGEHDGTIEFFYELSFYIKMAANCENFNFVRFQWKFISWGNLMWRTWW